ncbi:MAG: zinc-dependent metalloprotease [Fimbriimonas sp.]
MFSALVLPTVLLGQALPPIADHVKQLGLTRREGLLRSYLDGRDGKIYLEIPAPDPVTGIAGEYLYAESLRSGLGSNEVGLDRGDPGGASVVRLRPVGTRVLLEQPNLTFRASSEDPDERRAVAESFPSSVLLAFPVRARDADGRTLVEATDFVVRDAHGAGRTLGGYSLDKERSALSPEACKTFPLNLEFEARLTFTTSGAPNPEVAEVSPDGRAVTLVQHQTLARLPEPGYRPRAFDPRAGAWSSTTYDFSAPLGQSLRKRVIFRHRLEKTDPTAARSTVKKPIVYYVDRGAPEPIRTALLEGARYWTKAFENAGYIDAYKVELLPPGADPADLRYNTIQWVHRSTRGYSYGSVYADPRTGEIVKGNVSLDSSRGRQDVMLFEGLMGADETGKGGPNDPVTLALARLRQLAAHEVGHTLGFAHNFGSSGDDRASVMDYPAPWVKAQGGELDFSQSYVDRGGAWDDFLVRYAYSDFATPEDERTGLEAILKDAAKLAFLSDQDADEQSGADPRAVRFDNGRDPVGGLREALEVRKIALARFGERNLPVGEPLGRLEEVLGPVYFYHRYAVDGALRMVGGMLYVHTVRGDGRTPTAAVPGEAQRAALEALLDATQPEVLDLPAGLAKLLAPPAYGYSRTRESFATSTRFTFDSLGAANSAADLVIGRLLDPARCHRVVELSTHDASLPNLDEVLDRIVRRTFWVAPPASPRERELRQGVQDVVLNRLMDLADAGSPSVRYRARATLVTISERLAASTTPRNVELTRDISLFLNRPATATPRKPAALPPLPGAPIGGCG